MKIGLAGFTDHFHRKKYMRCSREPSVGIICGPLNMIREKNALIFSWGKGGQQEEGAILQFCPAEFTIPGICIVALCAALQTGLG